MYLLEKSWNRLIHGGWYKCEDYTSRQKPIVIGGCARSGTTLIRVILDSHENIYCGPESNLFCSDDNRNGRRISNLSYKFDIPKIDIKNMIMKSHCETEFIEFFFNYLLSVHEKKRWAEKSPKNIRKIGEIYSKFPHAKFIHVIRDGRDVSCSLRHHPRNKLVDGKIVPVNTTKPLNLCIKQWLDDLTLGLKWRSDRRYTEIKYEDIIFNLEGSLRKLFSFIDEPFSDSILRHHERNMDRNKFITSQEAVDPISTRSFGRWKKEYSENDKLTFKEIAGEMLIKLGYERDSDW